MLRRSLIIVALLSACRASPQAPPPGEFAKQPLPLDGGAEIQVIGAGRVSEIVMHVGERKVLKVKGKVTGSAFGISCCVYVKHLGHGEILLDAVDEGFSTKLIWLESRERLAIPVRVLPAADGGTER